MSVIKKSEFNTWIPNGDTDSKECFFCGKPIGELSPNNIGVVCWAGFADEWLYFHPQCAQQLGMHLIKDGLIAESGIKGYTP